jgi:hypothetical protein
MSPVQQPISLVLQSGPEHGAGDVVPFPDKPDIISARPLPLPTMNSPVVTKDAKVCQTCQVGGSNMIIYQYYSDLKGVNHGNSI